MNIVPSGPSDSARPKLTDPCAANGRELWYDIRGTVRDSRLLNARYACNSQITPVLKDRSRVPVNSCVNCYCVFLYRG
ncbi:unnamed protein product [Acanthoscelides obtectus]|nr:unnamed protein product [Acanthoscelides obtectus]CAK1634102.1 hypothetical protein AOBTE_LOCUS8609 [Acanthoscelides obtectus]